MRDFFVFRTSLPWWPVIAAAAVGTGAALRLLPRITPADFAMVWVFAVGLALAVNIGKFAARYEVPMSLGLGNSVAALAVSMIAANTFGGGSVLLTRYLHWSGPWLTVGFTAICAAVFLADIFTLTSWLILYRRSRGVWDDELNPL